MVLALGWTAGCGDSDKKGRLDQADSGYRAAGAPTDADVQPSKAGSGSNPSEGGSTIRDASATDAASARDGAQAGDASASYPPLKDGCAGYATRYWDCCKPHCGWSANVSGAAPLASCSGSDVSLGSDYAATSSCDGGDAFLCYGMAPWAADDRLAFGFAAIAARGDICGRCYELQFSGSSHDGADPGSAALAGKTMVVQAMNVGGDVGSGQFDLLIPGGGVGAFNACSNQWSVSASELGAQYGGFLALCKQQVGTADLDAIKGCVRDACTRVFGAHGLSELEAGCRWFVDWFEAADNPALLYREVVCPPELRRVGIDRAGAASDACGV